MERLFFCDIGNVLVHFDLFAAIDRFVKIGRHPVHEVLPKIFDINALNELETGRMSTGQFHRRCCEAFGMRVGYRRFCEIWNGIFTENQRMTRWVKEISRKHRVYLISNSNEIHAGYLRERFGLSRLSRACLFSNEVGMRKPDPRIFYHALRMANVSPRQAFYLDDIGGHVAAARRCGMIAHRYTTPEAARAAWQRFLSRHP